MCVSACVGSFLFIQIFKELISALKLWSKELECLEKHRFGPVLC